MFEKASLAIELVRPGIVNLRVRALPNVHLRSPWSRSSFCRGLLNNDEEFLIKKFEIKQSRKRKKSPP